jgi:membrane protein YdbS with pleckstrin-like domain
VTSRPNWGRIATFSLIGTIVIAAVLYFAIPGSRWIAVVVLALGVIEAALLLLVMPRLSGAEEDVPIRDGDWGVATPSEPADPMDD